MVKDAGLYLYTLIIVYKLCSMFGTLNELSLQKELRHFMYIMHLGTQSKITTKQNKNIKHKYLGR